MLSRYPGIKVIFFLNHLFQNIGTADSMAEVWLYNLGEIVDLPTPWHTPASHMSPIVGDILYQGGKLGGHLFHLSISPGQANTWPGEQVMQVKSHKTMRWPPQVTRKSGEQVFCVLTVKKIICRLDRTVRSSSCGCWSEVLPNMYCISDIWLMII